MSSPADNARVLGIRRWGDPCFHAVEEEVPEGYILDGVLVRKEDVEESRWIDPKDPHSRAKVLKVPERRKSQDGDHDPASRR